MKIREKLKCGDCGGDTFKLKYLRDTREGRFGGGGYHQGKVMVICTKCKEETSLQAKATVSLEPDGHLCGGWDE